MARSGYVLPTCLGLMICDTVLEDVRTHNKSLINMFNGILTPAVPARHDKMCVFLVFTGGRGRVPVKLRLCHDQEYEKDLLPPMGGDVDFPPHNPHAVVDMVFEIRGFVFPQFGSYTFEILCNEVPLVSRRFTVSPPPPPFPPGEEPTTEAPE